MRTSSSLGDLAVAFTCLAAVVVVTGFTCLEIGRDEGRTQANREMWEKPPHSAYCVVYPDGGKKCVDLVKPARACKTSILLTSTATRMGD